MKTRRKQQGGHHLYKRLGVSKYASQKLIRKAFKTLKKKNIPLLLLNARLTEKSFSRWYKYKFFSKSIFNLITLLNCVFVKHLFGIFISFSAKNINSSNEYVF